MNNQHSHVIGLLIMHGSASSPEAVLGTCSPGLAALPGSPCASRVSLRSPGTFSARDFQHHDRLPYQAADAVRSAQPREASL
jgi:hypothetical protein